MKSQKIFLLAALILFSLHSQGQKMTSITPERPIVCYSDAVNRNTSFGPPEAFLKARNNPAARTQTAVFEVTYSSGFTPQAKAAFQFAVDIWASILQSPVKIKINAVWQPLGANVLGSAIWANAYANFPNAQKLNTYYPVALAEKIAQKDLNHPDSADIYANFSSNTAWYYGTSGIPPANTTDLVSVVLHEIGHGLGFVDSYSVDSGGSGSVAPFVYDLGVENNNTPPQNLYQSFTTPSAALGTELISNKIFYNSLLANQANGGQHVKLYAPATWSGGSSISHLDETTYPAGDPNSLMTPQIGFKEVMHDPGSIMLAMFSDMGWVGTRIDHTPSNKESIAATNLIAKVTSDNGYSASSVKLKYIKRSGGAEVELVGTPTANANEFSFPLPAFANPDTLFYYISATDNLNRLFTNPGKFVRSKNTELQGKYTIGFGTDTKGPVIAHTAKSFILASATSLQIDAIVSDNIGVQSVSLDYSINNTPQTTVAMVQVGSISTSSSSLIATSSSKYTTTLSFAAGTIKDGDVITYKITAIDNSLAQNSSVAPTSSTKYSVNVVGLTATKDSYQNNFNDLLSTDFFGDTQFSIKKETQFTDGAIHSIHPYPEAGKGPNLNFIYELRVPIKIKSVDATIKFDEIVLVEPGTSSVFPSVDFFDYVITEGSTDGGTTWKPFLDGYDSRDYAPWLTKYNASIISNISQGVGDPSLFRSRSINMLDKFKAGDEVVIRFRLFSDPGAAGWGWAIDNLKIQIDETPPTTLHNHFNYITSNAKKLDLVISASDPSGLKSLSVEYKINNGAIQIADFPVSNDITQYTLKLDTTNLVLGDLVEYRIKSSDDLNNALVLPSADFFKVPFISFGAPVTQYTADFNSANADFVGNFFSIATPSGFTDGAIQSSHPYPNGFGTNSISLFTYTLKKPITVSNTNHVMVFNEIVIAESTLSNEYAVVEGSKDNGITWEPLVDKYSSSSSNDWLNAFNSKQNGILSLYKLRIIDLTQTGKFKAGDNILIRFKLSSNATNNGWGWAIDNLSIQGPITGIERNLLADALSIYPNPTTNGAVYVEFATEEAQPIKFQMLNSFGQLIQENTVTPIAKTARQEYDITNWANGIYIVKTEINGNIITKKFIKAQ